jgi:YbbR domain-containing protein
MEITRDIPIQLKLPPDFVLVDINTSTLSATLRGAKSILQKAELEKIQYFRDLSDNAQPGKITFLVSESDLELPKFVSVVSMIPDEITLVIDRMAEKDLAVEPVLANSPVDGFKVEGVSVNPSVVKVKGPSTMLKRSTKIGTQPVDLTGRNRSFFQKVPIRSLVKGQESEIIVEVYVRIREEVEEKTFDNHPIKVLESVSQNWEVSLDPRTASVLVGGNKEVLNKLAPSEITLFLDLADLKPGEYELPVQSKAPKDMTVLKIIPATVKVRPKEGGRST